MVKRSKHIGSWSLLVLLTAASFGAPLLAAETSGQDDSNQSNLKPRKVRHNPSQRREIASARSSKHGQHTIIFVGGKKGGQGAATKSNPTRAIKSNGTLNPQPIPPGRQRQPK